jgi:hypothetical protein
MTKLRAMVSTIALLLLVGLAGGLAAAESTGSLTQRDIQSFLQSIPDVEKLSEKFTDDGQAAPLAAMAKRDQNAVMGGTPGMAAPSKEQLERAAAPLSFALPGMRANKGYPELVATVEKHGFSSVEEWAATGDRSIRAYAALRMETEAPKVEAQMKEMRANLAKSGMPAAQQEAMLKMLNSSADVMNTFADVPAADKKAVKPFASQFEKLGD